MQIEQGTQEVTHNDENILKQTATAESVMNQHSETLSALAKDPESASDEFKAKLEAARERMKKYHAVYRRLAE